MQDIFIIYMPTHYKVKFESDKKYKYTEHTCKAKTNLKNALLDSSNGYCMYCYSKIVIDNKNYGHLEHTIEQSIAQSLKECRHNLSIACPTCNTSCKTAQQEQRKIEINEIFNCDTKDCTDNFCDTYTIIANRYISNMCQKNLDKIILRPHPVHNSYNNITLDIIYDLLEFKFKPAYRKEYNQIDKDYIQSHIDKFYLNDEKYYTREIKYVIEDFFELKKIPNKKRYQNLVAELFIENLEKYYCDNDFNFQIIEDLCTDLYSIIIEKNV